MRKRKVVPTFDYKSGSGANLYRWRTKQRQALVFVDKKIPTHLIAGGGEVRLVSESDLAARPVGIVREKQGVRRSLDDSQGPVLVFLKEPKPHIEYEMAIFIY